jgi:ribosome biogenesis GTPase A
MQPDKWENSTFFLEHNDLQETISGVRPHILVLNKEDLVPKENRDGLIHKIKVSTL